jgi:putative oligomerization/nucleic acid binding protein
VRGSLGTPRPPSLAPARGVRSEAMGLLFRRRRPLLGAAMLAGAGTLAYRAGQRRQSEQDEYDAHEYDQDQAIAGGYQQASPAGGPAGGGTAGELERLKSLLDQGVLTQEEFAAAKQKVLAG